MRDLGLGVVASLLGPGTDTEREARVRKLLGDALMAEMRTNKGYRQWMIWLFHRQVTRPEDQRFLMGEGLW